MIFGKKMENFVLLFLGQNEARNNVSRCFRYKRNYFRVKSNNFLEGQKSHFSKGVNT